ncbi:P-loop containing nucleoside triphosphate hydrolase protein [Pseudovirgaria hyperparasitica]|uniref:RNA helicase n=1 Tax=Pseudovirgaria hyperparasitica TaxID=470096 RepID=A0A6A6WKK8_9PEZI|nr:P-loop containing nucleoside triphosphate hydrolase protein [Pseudovirgaria hyperparasitica]KAF2762708.1 P-loop containing nucleoside triphosphate hydrolase protein [Pseudovirgaria hyperparasitica]
MPKNAHPPRGGGPSKKPPPGLDEGSYIVFSNAKDDDKKSKKQGNGTVKPAVEDKGSKVKGKGKEAVTPADDAPKKPDVKTLIGGASWTGKLPVNMLSEHCQKQKWGKPEYTMQKTQDGFRSTVIMKTVHPKTQEVTVLPAMEVPPAYRKLSCQSSAVEARHFAAAYALFRVANMRNVHMMMPPTYKDLWKNEFQSIKKEDQEKGNGYMYEADPFLAKSERDAAKAAAEKKREQKAKQQAQTDTGVSQPGIVRPGGTNGTNARKDIWSKAPSVEMGKRLRTEVERLIRKDAVWNPNGVDIDKNTQRSLVDALVGLGFRHSHVEEAAEICKDREEVLEWLLIHVPEDDLPPWCLPENYSAGISLASGNLKREAKLKRLAAGGYAAELCEVALIRHQDDEGKAAELLQYGLLGIPDQLNIALDASKLEGEAEAAEAWNEEQTVLSSIFDDRYKSSSEGVCDVELELKTPTRKPITLHARRPTGAYPNVLPVILIVADLPAYIRLSITRRALLYAQDNLLGESMLFNLVDWLEQEIPGIIENPGRLAEVSSGVTAGEANTQTQRPKNRSRGRRQPKAISLTPGSLISQQLLSRWQARQETPAQHKMLSGRMSLPAWNLQETIVNSVQRHQVVIISGETGSGKSTQSVQFVLDDMIKRELGESANIICTQPRRISALGLADRVADERCGVVGGEVGYSIRGESRQTPGATKITFVTTGVLLRRLQTSGGSSEDVVAALADVSHVVVDEVHERSLDTDFLLVLLRDVLRQRKDLKVILMSATLDADVFEKYFSSTGKVGRVEIQGRTHPVQDLYIDDVLRMTNFGGTGDEDYEEEDGKDLGTRLRSVGMRVNYDLIASTVAQIDADLCGQDGGILIFLPGTMEIDRTLQALRRIPNLHALPLHASLLSAEQKRVFHAPPKGMRKVVAATNVAETSITIEDIVAVIDTGRVKETSFDPQNNMVKLEEVWASRAACKQRRGRAGRVRAGNCYKLYTRTAEMNKMAERPEPEIRRVPLEQLCLSVRAMGVKDVQRFLAGALTPPDSVAVEGAVDLLQRMGALDGDDLTALGRHLSMIPADLRCGKLLVYGATFGCLDACLTIASILTVRSPFVSPKDKRDESKAARSFFADGGHGDLIADLKAYDAWQAVRSKGVSAFDTRKWCERSFLSQQTLFDISSNRAQYLSSLKETGFIPLTYTFTTATNSPLNRQCGNIALLRALIAGSFNPQIARIDFPEKRYEKVLAGTVALDPEARTIKYFNQENGRVFVHPSSTLFDAQAFPTNSAFMSYFNKMATSKVFIRELTPFNSYSMLLFGGQIELDTQGRGLTVDGWVRLRGWARIGVLVGRLRGMLDEVLRRKIETPELDLAKGREGEIIGVVRKLVELGGMDD